MTRAIRAAMLVLAANQCGAVGPDDPIRRDAEVRALQEAQREQAPRRAEAAPALRWNAMAGAHRVPVANEFPCRVVRRLVLRGAQATRFSWVLAEFAPFEGLCLGAGSLQALLLNLNDALLAQGYVTSRIVLEPQDLSSGVLTATLNLGFIDAIEWTDGTQRMKGDSHALPAAAGDVLDVRDLDQALENLGRLPSLATRVFIEPGAVPNTSTVRIEKRRVARRWRGQVGVDNSAPREFGRTRLSAWVGVDAPLGWADQLSLGIDSNLEHPGPDHRSSGANWSWSVPLGYHLFSCSQSASRSGRLVEGTTLRFQLASRDRQREARWRGTLLRTPLFRLDAFASVGRRWGRTQLDDIELIVQRRDSRRREAGVSLQARAGSAEAQVTLSEAHTKRLPLPEAFRDPTEPDVALTQRVQVDASTAMAWLGSGVNYTVHLDAQRTRRPLAVSSPVVLGSRETVRGYSGEHTLSAPSGVILRQELHWPALQLPDAQALVAPYLAADFGLLDGPQAAMLPRRRLAGVAVGARLQHARWSAEVALAAPLRAPDGFPGTEVVPYLSFALPL